MEILAFLCMIVVVLAVAGFVISMVFGTIGDALESAYDAIGPIPAIIIAVFVLFTCCGMLVAML